MITLPNGGILDIGVSELLSALLSVKGMLESDMDKQLIIDEINKTLELSEARRDVRQR